MEYREDKSYPARIYVAKKPVYGKNPIVKPRLIELSDERAIRIWADSVGTIPSTLKADARDGHPRSGEAG